MSSAITDHLGSKRSARASRMDAANAALPAETLTITGPSRKCAGVVKSPGSASSLSARATSTPRSRDIPHHRFVHVGSIGCRKDQPGSFKMPRGVRFLNLFDARGDHCVK